MIGFNGGLIGGFRDTAGVASVPGVWTANEQVVAQRRRKWIEFPPDPFFSSVSLLLPGDGANGSTSIIDCSPSPKTVTAFGNAQISTAQSRFGGSSIAFDGNGDYLTLSNVSSLRPENTDYTLELWFYQRSKTNAGNATNLTLFGTHWSGSTPSGAFILYASTVDSLIRFAGWNTLGLASTSNIALSTWYHIAVVKSGTLFSLYINGILEASANSSLNLNNSTYPIEIGRYVDPSDFSGFFDGYIDDLRITKGVARYTANFTPPTLPHPVY